MNLVELITADGHGLKKTASTGGGEYAGPCPWCGGNDRFRVWPKTGRFWCRACGKAGDEIQYLRDARGMTFREACEAIGHTPAPRASAPRPAPAAWAPRAKEAPSEVWQAQARAFLDEAVRSLWTPAGAAVRRWLHAEKGLTETSIRKAYLGLALADLYTPRQGWGLQDSTNKVWVPSGLVIPLLQGDTVHRLRIRRTEDAGPRYVVISGSSSAPMTWGHDKAAAVVVESELDGLLLAQAAGDLAAVVALGSAQAKPDVTTHRLLQDTPLILVALDADEAGAKLAWQFWPQTYGTRVKRWPSIMGKDASEAVQKGLNLFNWICAGIFKSTEAFERFSIMTVDGKLSDRETIKYLMRRNDG